ncbi:phosphotransferase [bacterium]|nr:phosphotransferase [bacterium]
MTEPGARLRGMVLAAGYGTRLAPLTDHVPKPLLPVDGRPLLDHVLDALLAAGCDRIGVNTHHLGRQVRAHLAAHPRASRLVAFPEAEILGTGGALANARDFLADAGCILLHNGDVLADPDLAGLVADHRASGALATLLLVDWPAVNSVRLVFFFMMRRPPSSTLFPAPALFRSRRPSPGIAALDPVLLDRIGPGFSSLIAPLAAAVASGDGAVRGWAPAGLAWSDLGTPGRWLAHVGSDTPDGAPGLGVRRITGHGSDRRFWRLAAADWSAVAMTSPPGDDEHERFLAAAAFLAAHDLGPAAVLAVDDPGRTVLLEDLGRDPLGDLARRGPFPDEVYGQAVDWLVRLQAITPAAGAVCPTAVDRVLDTAALRDETVYFATRCLAGHFGLPDDDIAPLAGGFDALAAAVGALPQVLIHRDFQSANLLLHDGRVRPVDFQGLRLGPVAYDLASLVWDPYVDVPTAARQRLVARFAAAKELAPDTAAAMTTLCGLQRVMQALGAYGFLGHVKGRTGFLVHVPGAWNRLRALLAEAATLRAAGDPAVVDLGVPDLSRLAALVAAHDPAA